MAHEGGDGGEEKPGREALPALRSRREGESTTHFARGKQEHKELQYCKMFSKVEQFRYIFVVNPPPLETRRRKCRRRVELTRDPERGRREEGEAAAAAAAAAAGRAAHPILSWPNSAKGQGKLGGRRRRRRRRRRARLHHIPICIHICTADAREEKGGRNSLRRGGRRGGETESTRRRRSRRWWWCWCWFPRKKWGRRRRAFRGENNNHIGVCMELDFKVL